MNFSLFDGRVRCSAWGLVVYLSLMVLLINLGFWQLDRSEQKKQWLQQQQLAAQLPSININHVTDWGALPRYQRVELTGQFDDKHQFLLDNRIMNGKPGYCVITPFRVEGQPKAIFVNRGWIALGADRRVNPDVSIKSVEQSIKGRLNQFPELGIRLTGAEIPTDGWPAIVQLMDAKVLSARVGYDVHDALVELDSDQNEGYVRNWRTETAVITPEKHVAYAVQWFGLALTLTGLFIWITVRKKSEQTT